MTPTCPDYVHVIMETVTSADVEVTSVKTGEHRLSEDHDLTVYVRHWAHSGSAGKLAFVDSPKALAIGVIG